MRGSRFQHGDDDMESVPFSEIAGKHLVVEEKVDGGNCGVSFVDGELKLQSRGHYLRGGPREKQFDVLKQWTQTHEEALYEILTDRYVMYGESMRVRHTQFYNALPHYFMEFDVLDTHSVKFLSTNARNELLRNDKVRVKICPVPVLAVGDFRFLRELTSMIKQSLYVDPDSYVPDLMDAELTAGVKDIVPAEGKHLLTAEGLYIKWEENGHVLGRYKYVRDTFTSAILDSEIHWLDKPTVYNKLAPGAYERMFDSI